MTSTERALKALPLVILSIAGCSAVAVRLGIRTRLDSVPVASASVSLFSTNGKSALTALAPGQSANLVVDVLTQDGRHPKSVGAEAGTVLFDSFTITPSLITVDKHGRVAMPEDPRLSEHKSGRLNLSVVGQPGVTANLDIPLRYDIAYVANYSGRNGSDGINGSSGADGHSGSSGPPGDFDPKTGVHGSQGAGGSGSDGSRSGDGTNGGEGSPGGDEHVAMRMTEDTKPLLQVRAQSGTREHLYLIDPAGGSLKILADGGPGGRGGHGGSSGRSGSGGMAGRARTVDRARVGVQARSS